MITRRRSVLSLFTGLAVGLTYAAHYSQAGVSYDNPVGGWAYTYDGTFDAGVGGLPAGYGDSGDLSALDGTWQHDQGDKWDGTAPGDSLSKPGNPVGPPSTSAGGPAGTSPGGAGAFVDGETTYIRVQDAGNPASHGWTQGDDPENTNRRVRFGHDIQQNEGVLDEMIMSNTGVTISFRMRIPNTGPLDDVYLESGYDDSDFDSDLEVGGLDFLHWQRGFGSLGGFPDPNLQKSDGDADGNNTVDGTDFSIWEDQLGEGAPGTLGWLDGAQNGRGMPMVNGRGMISIVQNNSFDSDTSVSFSLLTSTDVSLFCSQAAGALCTGSGSGGLIMNNLNGDIPTNHVDSAGFGALNMLEINDGDLNEWNEFWITLENNGALEGNIEANVFLNGSTTPATFQVTLAAAGNATYWNGNNPFLEFGSNGNFEFGAFDLDFLSYSLGVHAPVTAPVDFSTHVAPEPGTIILLLLGTLSFCMHGRRTSATCQHRQGL